MTADIYDLNTKSSVEAITLRSGGISYLRKANMLLEAIIKVDLTSNTYTLSDNSLLINTFSMFGEGSVQVLENNDLKIEGNLSTPTKDLKILFVPYTLCIHQGF